jgi:hypothetical protein
MGFDSISVTPLSPHIGAEVEGVDLREPLRSEQVEEVHAALMRHLVVFFRDQPIDFVAHKRFCSYFGAMKDGKYGSERIGTYLGIRGHSLPKISPMSRLSSKARKVRPAGAVNPGSGEQTLQLSANLQAGAVLTASGNLRAGAVQIPRGFACFPRRHDCSTGRDDLFVEPVEPLW